MNNASSIEFNGEELVINTLDKDLKLIFKRLY
ncbi:modification methylase [Brachyspira pilosicoli P43/6/78]|uniref:Modification methylase n=1 Tax=Brachyspira pilosicoli P43/6/78 TaxID=1042417 RepID=A0A3B6VIY9_BRAPL|nr:modification methylase [Brachyspira pilosicoli P43/6/78]